MVPFTPRTSLTQDEGPFSLLDVLGPLLRCHAWVGVYPGGVPTGQGDRNLISFYPYGCYHTHPVPSAPTIPRIAHTRSSFSSSQSSTSWLISSIPCWLKSPRSR